MLVVCRSEYVAVVRTIVDRSILMCNQCVCMYLCHLYLDCVVSNKNVYTESPSVDFLNTGRTLTKVRFVVFSRIGLNCHCYAMRKPTSYKEKIVPVVFNQTG
jgi:hypothetical protein